MTSQSSSLSVVILHRNQSSQVATLVASIPDWVQEVVVIDDDSLPEHLSRLRSLPARVISHPLQSNFAQQRNFALDQVTGEWTLFLDADEQPTPEFFSQLHQLLTQPLSESVSAYSLVRHQAFLGRVLQYGDAGKQRIIRLGQTQAGQGGWQRPVHEVWQWPRQEVEQSNLVLIHHNARDITEFFAKLNTYASLEHQARPKPSLSSLIFQLLIYPLGKFLFNYLWKGGIFDGFPGLAHAWSMSYYSAITRIFLYEKYYCDQHRLGKV